MLTDALFLMHYILMRQNLPLLRNLPNPLNPGILHLPFAAHALGDSLGDDRLFELLVFLNGGLGALDDSVNLGAAAVEEGGDAVLLRDRRNGKQGSCKVVKGNTLSISEGLRKGIHISNESHFFEDIAIESIICRIALPIKNLICRRNNAIVLRVLKSALETA